MKTLRKIYVILTLSCIVIVLFYYRKCIDWGIFFTAVGAIGSIAVAILAIWGDFFRAKFYGPKLELLPRNFIGTFAPMKLINKKTGEIIKSTSAYYYHLTVVNYRSYITAKNCRVMLKQITRKGSDGIFHPETYIVPLQYVWSPSEFSPILQHIKKEAVLDFGRISPNESFTPTLYLTSGNFRGFVDKDETVRYSLEIVAENYISSKYYTYEVNWNWIFHKIVDTPNSQVV